MSAPRLHVAFAGALVLACGSGPAPAADGTTPPREEAPAPAPPAEPVDAPTPADTGDEGEEAAPSATQAAPTASSRLADARVIVSPAAQAGLRELVAGLPREGNLWVGQLAGNGGRDVLIYIPPGADQGAKFRLIYHFHGTNSEHVQVRAPGLAKKEWVGADRLQQTLDGARALQAEVPENVALIYPFSAGKRMEPEWQGWSNKVYDRMWMRSAPPAYTDDFEALHAEVTRVLSDELGVHPSKLPDQVLAEGHSAGGIALWNIARSGTRRVRDYLFLDAGFHEWADGCHAEIKARRAGARVVLVIRDGGIADPMQGPDPWCVEIPKLAAAWPEVKATCAGDPKRKPRGDGLTCARWQALVETWPKVQDWCAAMKDDMRGVDDVLVHRTRVVHGEQPRAFFGGLGIPELTGGAG